MRDQERRLRAWGIHSCLSPDISSSNINDVLSVNPTLMFITPEALKIREWRQVFLSEEFRKKILFDVDESNCISEWGGDFRPEFRLIGEVRSLLSVPILAVTATATQVVQDDIRKYLFLRENTLFIGIIPEA
ncbi:hypothetical protein DPMN_127987 [Dreissena polymorpha]|uniref:DNA 3'-5' helicase n=1 Tax=Dreissena polymorpha TaxID=45954 RepID=A0A9D4H314_DREPO|nr:hypothetical protein DPMN_127987 [Dreissena polymorpha]